MNKTEAIVLGSILCDTKAFYDCLIAGISEASFENAKNARIWKAMLTLHEQDKDIDETAICLGITQKDYDNDWSYYIHSLTLHRHTNPSESIKALKAMEIKRKALQLIDDAKKDRSDNMVGNLIGDLMKLQVRSDTQAVKVGDLRQEKVKQWRMAKEHGFVGLPFCISAVNEFLGGWRPSCFALLGGYRGEGKSTLLRQDAYFQARQGRKAMLFSLEDPADIASASIAALHVGVSTFHLDTGKAYEGTIEKIDAGWRELADLPLWIHSCGMTITQIIGATEAAYHRHGLDIVYGDHIQYISPLIMRGMTRNDTLSHYSMQLAALAKRLDIPVVFASQLSRSSEKEQRKPRLTDLRDSGTLEADARQVLLLYWDGEAGHHKLDVAKNNYGASGQTIDVWRLDGKHKFTAAIPESEYK